MSGECSSLRCFRDLSMFEYYPLCGTMFMEGVVSAGKVIGWDRERLQGLYSVLELVQWSLSAEVCNLQLYIHQLLIIKMC